MLIGAGVAFSLYVVREQRERDVQLRQDRLTATLQTLRGSLRSFREKNGRYPSSLAELGNVPADPITGKVDWAVTTEEAVQPASDFTATQMEGRKSVIIDVRSSAIGTDAQGKAWSSY